MSCWRRTTVLRIPASALGFEFRKQWDAFLREHEEEFDWEPGYFNESLSDSYPWPFNWDADLDDLEWRLGSRDPKHPDVVPGPFFDYCIDEIIPLDPEDNSYGEDNEVEVLDKIVMEEYLPLYQKLFPKFTLKDMEAVRWCRYEWYDGTNAPYLYSDLD